MLREDIQSSNKQVSNFRPRHMFSQLICHCSLSLAKHTWSRQSAASKVRFLQTSEMPALVVWSTTPLLQQRNTIKSANSSGIFFPVILSLSYLDQPTICVAHILCSSFRTSNIPSRLSNPARRFSLFCGHNGLHCEDVSPACEGLPGCEEHTCIFQVVGVAGWSVTLLAGVLALVGQRLARSGGLLVVRPGCSVAGSTGARRVTLWHQPYRWSPPPPAAVKKEPQLLAERGIQAAVDERVVAGGAHGQPVKAEIESVGGVDGLAREQHHIAVEREPADGKHNNNQEQHGQCASPLLSLSGVLSCCRVTNDVVAPQSSGHRGVGGRDDEERKHVEQNESEKIYVLPVDVRWLWKVWHTQATLHFLTGGEAKETWKEGLVWFHQTKLWMIKEIETDEDI